MMIEYLFLFMNDGYTVDIQRKAQYSTELLFNSLWIAIQINIGNLGVLLNCFFTLAELKN